MKKALLALAAVSTLAAAVPASAEYFHVTGNHAYFGGIGLPNDGSIPYEKGPYVKTPFVGFAGRQVEQKFKVKPGDTIAYSKYYGGKLLDHDTWYEYKVPAGYDVRVHFAGTLFNQSLDVWLEPTTDPDSQYYVGPKEPTTPVEKYVKPKPTAKGWNEFLDDLRDTDTNNLTIFGN